MGRRLAGLAAVLAALMVALGAFGAHALSQSLRPSDMATFRTGVQYGQWHLLAMLVAGLFHWRTSSSAALQAAWGFLVGVLLFSGSLIVLSVTGYTWLGAVAPIGGLFLILSWLLLAWAIWNEESL